MIDFDNNFSPIEQTILKKMFNHSLDFGDIVEISEFANELNFSKPKLLEIVKNMNKKGWFKIYELGWDYSVMASLSNEAIKMIGESPIIYSVDIKDIKINNGTAEVIIIIEFYNNSTQEFSFSPIEYAELELNATQRETSQQQKVTEWLKKHSIDLYNLLLKQNKKKHTKKLSDLITSIQD